MRHWWAAAMAAVTMIGAGEARAQAIASLPFEPNSVIIRADVREYLTELAPQAAGYGDLRLIGEADPGEAAAAAAWAAAERAHVIASLLRGEGYDSHLPATDMYFDGAGDTIGPEGARSLDRIIAHSLERTPFLVFLQAGFSADAAEQRRLDAFAQALFERGAIWIRADGDDFGVGSVMAPPALVAEIEDFKRTNTAKIIVVQPLEPNLAEGETLLPAFALARAENVRNYLAAAGAPYGRLSVESVGATETAEDREHQRWVHVIAQAASGW